MQVLEFEEPNPTPRKIHSHCRKLSSKFHPDRHRNVGDREKVEIEKKFVEIQQACGILNKVKMNRERKNKWSVSGMENWKKDEDIDIDEEERENNSNELLNSDADIDVDNTDNFDSDHRKNEFSDENGNAEGDSWIKNCSDEL